MGATARFVVVMVVAMVGGMVGSGVQDTPSCLSSLLPCFVGYNLNPSATPSSDCCSRLKTAVDSEFKCVCDLFYNSTSYFKDTINVTWAQELPTLCNINFNQSQCMNNGTNNGSSGKNSSNGSGNAALKMTMGMNPWWVSGLLLAALLVL